MEHYYGTKAIKAMPMNRQEYTNYRGWQLPADENGADEGMLVECIDGGKPNDSRHEGYISWSPIDVFNNAYKKSGHFSFGIALEILKSERKVARAGWNGKNQWVVMMPALYLPPYNTQELGAKVNDRTAKHIGVDTQLDSQPYFALFNAQGKWQPGWVPSTSDCLANDWMEVV